MKEKVYVDRLFAGYEDTPEIRDFKEEIAGNLKERVRELMTKGFSEEEAFEKATAELGDITAIADDLGKIRRNEAICQMYIGANVPLTKRTAIGFTVATGLLLLSIGLDMMVFFGDGIDGIYYYVAAVLFADAIGMFAFFGLTQETATEYPMKDRRALAYSVAIAGVVFGFCVGCVMFFFGDYDIPTVLGIEGAFLIPSVCGLVFLGSTESDRTKPWAKTMMEEKYRKEWQFGKQFENDMVDPVRAARFGVASGGLWMTAIILCIILYFVMDWQYSWVVILLALPIQVFMAATIFGRSGTIR
jgi:hypothetical protein